MGKQHIQAHQKEEQEDTNVMKAASTWGSETEQNAQYYTKPLGNTKEKQEKTHKEVWDSTYRKRNLNCRWIHYNL